MLQALSDGEGPWGVDRHAEGAVQDHPPVSEFIVETLHHQGPVTGNDFRGFLLFPEVLQQVAGGKGIQAAGLAAFHGGGIIGS
ncbi:hypothetical protein PJL18_03255 [Paenarthrobacter nicotinovorans]|nr:hypothetical protein [Paenarthrobacter nicotinovorans]